jgi:hypothetical protein
VHLHGDAASADTEAAENFVHEFKNIISEGNYSPEQVWNVDETGLNWKRMPTTTFMSREETSNAGIKTLKNRLTLMLGGNASGDTKLEPLLVYQALKNVNFKKLPVIWKSNKKAWVTRDIFQDWFVNYFEPFICKYCIQNNLSKKALLIMDNAPGHPIDLTEKFPHIKVIFMPPNTTSILQPMDQGVIANFKLYYRKESMKRLSQFLSSDDDCHMVQFWKKFTVKDSIDITEIAWNSVLSSAMNGTWKKLWPECVNNFKGFEEGACNLTKDIVRLAHDAGLQDVEEIHVNEMNNEDNNELTNQELMELDIAANEDDLEDKEELVVAETAKKELSAKILSEIFSHCEAIEKLIEENDPDCERAESLSRKLNSVFQCYQEVYSEKKKKARQPTITSFFNKKS